MLGSSRLSESQQAIVRVCVLVTDVEGEEEEEDFWSKLDAVKLNTVNEERGEGRGRQTDDLFEHLLTSFI